MLDQLLSEMRQEAAITRRVLERVPGDRLDWRPHPKSMTLGELALHLATIPGNIARLVSGDEFDAAGIIRDHTLGSTGQLMEAFHKSLEQGEQYLGSLSSDRAAETWRLTHGGKELLAVPRLGFIRSVMFNHLYHHRGQLSVYLRMLDVPLPSIYGPSADEMPAYMQGS